MEIKIKKIYENKINYYKQCLKIVEGTTVEEVYFRGCISAIETLLKEIEALERLKNN